MRLALFFCLLWFTACSQQSGKPAANGLTDALGRTVPLQTRPRTVMALAPSETEMLALVVNPGQLLARTTHCNFPEWVKRKPAVSTYPLDVERVLQLKPDLVFTAEGMTSQENAAKLQELGVPVYYQRYRDVNDVFEGIENIGRITGYPERAKKTADSLRRELEQVKQLFDATKPRPRVVALSWQDPIMVYGRNTLFTDKIKLAGGVNAVDTAFSNPYPPVTREYLLKLNPDVIISRDYGFEAMDTTFFRMYPELRALKAYQTKRIFAIDPDLMERPSPRVVESVKELQELLEK